MASSRRNRLIGLLALVGLATLGFIAWHRNGNPSPLAVDPPEIPALVVDPEVNAALTKARERVVLENRSAAAWGNLGVLFRAHKILPQADACFAEAAKLEPDNPRWPYLLGLDKLQLSATEALAHLRAAYTIAKQADEKSAARLQLAEALLDLNQLDESEKLFAEDLASDPTNARARYGLGVIAITRNNDAKAISHLTPASTSPYYRHKALSLLIACHNRLGNNAEAEKCARENKLPPADRPWPDPFESDPSLVQLGQSARQQLVNTTESQGKILDVLSVLDEIARDHPDDPTQIPRAIHLLQLGDFRGSERACRDALAINPDNASGRCFLGVALYFQAVARWNEGKRDEARKMFEAALAELKRSIELKPDFGYAHLHTGFALKYLGKTSEAADAFRMTIQVAPYNSHAHLALGELLIDMGKPSEAVPTLENAARLSRPNDNRARALLEKIRDQKR